MLNLSDRERQIIVDAIRLDFTSRVQHYDSRKYPEAAYEKLRIAFSTPKSVTDDDIKNALVWKYGHWHKSGYPEKHRILIGEIQNGWPDFVASQSQVTDARQIFDYWMGKLKGHQCFITIAFLVHLLRSDQISIIDQHNYRAMNHLLKKVRGDWIGRQKPSHFDDMLDLSEFIHSVQETWHKCGYPSPPDERSIDKYLMVLGQELKASKNTSK
jgi:hypothetical protein